jgi:hypothetical protein
VGSAGDDRVAPTGQAGAPASVEQGAPVAVGPSLEAALEAVEGNVGAALRLSDGVHRELRKARVAAGTGQLRELRRALDAAATLARDLAERASQARADHTIDERALLADGSYAQELRRAADDAGLVMVEDEGQLLAYPSILRILPGDLAVQIDRKRERRLRPSVLVGLLTTAQQAGPRFRPGPILTSLSTAYDLVLARQDKPAGTVVRLTDVYGVLTLLPGQARDYTKQEFARDLYLLDQSGETTVGATERRLRWAASTGTKQSGVLMTVARSGQIQRYWGIAFREDGDG